MRDVGQRDHRAAAGLQQPHVSLQRAPRVDEVLEHVGGDQAVEAAEVAGDVLDVADDHAVAALLRDLRVGGLALDPDHLDRAALLERGGQPAGRAAEVQHAPRARRDELEDLVPDALVGVRPQRALVCVHAG